jgi:hypothetical protein
VIGYLIQLCSFIRVLEMDVLLVQDKVKLFIELLLAAVATKILKQKKMKIQQLFKNGEFQINLTTTCGKVSV